MNGWGAVVIGLGLFVSACSPQVTVTDNGTTPTLDAPRVAETGPGTQTTTPGSTTSASSMVSSDSGAPTAAPAVSSTEAPKPASSASTTTGLDPGPAIRTPLVGSFTVEIVASHPHDPTSYTQGLELHEGRLLESTGRRGQSTRRWVDPETGSVELVQPLPDDLFGEGITVVDDEIFQLTWTSGQLLVADLEALELTRVLTYAGEGWGLCFDGEHLVMSNGSSQLTERDPTTFAVVRTIDVQLNGSPLNALNELECIGDQVLANVYRVDQIVAIDQDSGNVDAVIDASPLRPPELPIGDVDYALNGIAHDASTGRYLMTGKLWPVLYEVELVAQ
jgi:glutaminyl-peptide cyclotransferase